MSKIYIDEGGSKYILVRYITRMLTKKNYAAGNSLRHFYTKVGGIWKLNQDRMFTR